MDGMEGGTGPGNAWGEGSSVCGEGKVYFALGPSHLLGEEDPIVFFLAWATFTTCSIRGAVLYLPKRWVC